MEKKSTKINKDGILLTAWIKKNVAVGDYGATLLKIEEGCKVSRSRLNNWRNGLCRIPELYKDKICEVLGDNTIFMEG